MIILGIETATESCGVALLRDEQVEVELTLQRPKSHAEFLVPMIGDALRYARAAADEVSALAVSSGPGSYTGLRIGVSSAKGLAFASGAVLVGVPTLEALAFALPPEKDEKAVVAVLPARRDEFYMAAYTRVGDEAPVPLSPTSAVPAASLADWLREIPSDAQFVLGAVIEGWQGHLPERFFVPLHLATPGAAAVARLGRRKFLAGDVENISTFEPFYLKSFVARRSAGSAFDRLNF